MTTVQTVTVVTRYGLGGGGGGGPWIWIIYEKWVKIRKSLRTMSIENGILTKSSNLNEHFIKEIMVKTLTTACHYSIWHYRYRPNCFKTNIAIKCTLILYSTYNNRTGVAVTHERYLSPYLWSQPDVGSDEWGWMCGEPHSLREWPCFWVLRQVVVCLCSVSAAPNPIAWWVPGQPSPSLSPVRVVCWCGLDYDDRCGLDSWIVHDSWTAFVVGSLPLTARGTNISASATNLKFNLDTDTLKKIAPQSMGINTHAPLTLLSNASTASFYILQKNCTLNIHTLKWRKWVALCLRTSIWHRGCYRTANTNSTLWLQNAGVV